MKQLYKTVIILLLLVGVSLSLTTCGAFFITELPRTNPYDDESVVASISGLAAIIDSDNYIQLSWILPAERMPDSLTIVRNTTQIPRNLTDGVQYNGIDPVLGLWVDTEVSVGLTYYYGIWSVSSEGVSVGPLYIEIQVVPVVTELDASASSQTSIQLTWTVPDSGEIDSLSISRSETGFPTTPAEGIESKVLDPSAGVWNDTSTTFGTDYYYSVWSVDRNGVEAGPATVRETIALANIVLNPELDGSLNSGGGKDFGGVTMFTNWDGAALQDLSLIRFDVNGMPSFSESISHADLIINITATVGTGMADLYGIAQTWDTTVDWATASNPAFRNNEAPFFNGSPTVGLNIYDVTGYAEDTIDGIYFGFLLSGSGAAMAKDYTTNTAESGIPPVLDIYYYGDTY